MSRTISQIVSFPKINCKNTQLNLTLLDCAFWTAPSPTQHKEDKQQLSTGFSSVLLSAFSNLVMNSYMHHFIEVHNSTMRWVRISIFTNERTEAQRIEVLFLGPCTKYQREIVFTLLAPSPYFFQCPF